jgi:hypothetical protein
MPELYSVRVFSGIFNDAVFLLIGAGFHPLMTVPIL